jgi:hypothetical protein|tara:strand:- start:291 stop:830 length:540 start_codon:yes stop_codon:yes gene_type:complete
MQLLEYLMWIDQECSGLNQIATDYSLIHVVLQPVLSLFVAYLLVKKVPNWSYLLLLLYLVISLPKILSAKEENQCSKPCNGSDIGLTWDYTVVDYSYLVWILFAIALAAPFLLMKKNGYIYASLLIIAFVLSHFIALHRCRDPAPTNSWWKRRGYSSPTGSWWCLTAVLGPLCAIFINQ